MVPTLGMFDFIPVHLANASAEEAEREAYLSEVTRHSTEFGAIGRNEADKHIEENLRVALMHRF